MTDYAGINYWEVELSPCENCGSEACIPARRLGPTLLKYTINEYRVLCLKCWKKGVEKTTIAGAVKKWNENQMRSTK